MVDKHTLPPFQSYFWLYSPSGDIRPKKIKRAGDLPAIFAAQAKGNNPLSAKLCDIEHLYSADTRHLTVFEQPRTPEKRGEYRYQPVQTIEDILNMVRSAESVAFDYMPIELGGASLEIIEKTNKLHLGLAFNPEAERLFTEFYEDMMGELSEDRVHDLYKDVRKPRLFLGKAYKSELSGVDIKSARKSFNDAFGKFQTRPVIFDRLILGQGLFDINGKNLARRDVATIHFDGKPFEWHCGDPLDEATNVRLISQTAAARAQARVDGPRRPLPVS